MKKNQEIVPFAIESEDENFQTTLRALPNSSIFSELLTKKISSLMSSSNSLRINSFPCGSTVLGVPIYTLGGGKLRTRDNVYDLTPEIYKALSYTGYIDKTMKNENDFFLINNIINDLGYTGVGDRGSKRKTFFTITLPKLVDEIQNKTFGEIDLEDEGVKIIMPSNILEMYTKLEILLGLKLSGHTNTLTEASNLVDELYRRCEIQNKQQYRNALNKFHI